MSSRVAVVLTCHNRKAQTLACLRSVHGQRDFDGRLSTYVLDDDSTDGTSEAILARYPEATVLRGPGNLFWNRGMHHALERAYQDDHDFYLWLNDDTVLDDTALSTLLRTAARLAQTGGPPAIVVGSTRDPDTGALTYGGRARPSRIRRTAFRPVPPADEPTPTETMNGNVVLVPRPVAQRVGNIDRVYHHKWGDEDYGLRAAGAGCEVWLAPGTVGTCARNVEPRYGERPLRAELAALWGIKGFLPSDWLHFTRRWAGPLWPLFWLSAYLRRLLRMLNPVVRARHRRA